MVDFLNKYLKLFNAFTIESNYQNGVVSGKIRWYDDDDDDEPQEFVWTNDLDNSTLLKLIQIVNYLRDNNLVNGDKFILTEEELIKKMSKDGFKKTDIRSNIDRLLDVEIKYIDNGKTTDSLYLHF